MDIQNIPGAPDGTLTLCCACLVLAFTRLLHVNGSRHYSVVLSSQFVPAVFSNAVYLNPDSLWKVESLLSRPRLDTEYE